MGKCMSYEVPEKYKSVLGPRDDGSKVLNAMLAEVWLSMMKTQIEETKTVPYDLGKYRLQVKESNLKSVPVIQNIKISEESKITLGKPGGPVKFSAKIVYKGKPEVDLVLAQDKEENGFFGFLLPDINVELREFIIDAHIQAEFSLVSKTLKFYFLKTPFVHWDMDIDITKLEIPIPGENLLDSTLAKRLAEYDINNPKILDFNEEEPAC